MARLGLIDWGIGGIGVLKELRQNLGLIDVVYFSDTGATPYGKMSRKQLTERLDTVIAFLANQGASSVVIACNAASTAIPDLKDHGIKISGVIAPAIDLAREMAPKDLGLIAGRRTVVSGIYRRALAKHGIALMQRIAQPLSGMIERGDTDSDELHQAAKKIISPLKHCSHILLACTHYPAIANVLKKYISVETQLIDPAFAVVNEIKDREISLSGFERFFTTGDADAMKTSARSAFGVEIKKVEKAKI